MGKKSGLFLFLPDLSWELEILHAYRNCIQFLITLKQPMSEMLEKMTLFLSIQNLTNYNGSARIKGKSWNRQEKSNFSSISGIGCCRVIGNSIQFLNACKILSSKDKKGKNENKTDFCLKIFKY